MCDSELLSRCSSYEADVDSDSEISTTSSFSSCSYSGSEEQKFDNGFGAVRSKKQTKKLERKKSNVLLEGYVVDSAAVNDDLKRTKSLTDDDLEELKGCVDLGFGFNYEEIPELCNTLPALELCYSMSQKFIDQDHHSSSSSSLLLESPVSPIASWKISSPGDNPDDVKARLKFWAQAVACTVRLCT
ncbi:hypothetical protein CARUB_v10024131mg [Capsella rubella]|uniref:Uncharacterized protein n=1 Tax=Capsella rubella TaxID=81985 RepID=R0FYW8_9BRAS|nr:uncharacterized protein LOC17887944 [Capsella rubella]EOA27961.1 hypothetical protein CARUB_v10024131mg [Capsella rubella]